jgi:hypothetical protein
VAELSIEILEDLRLRKKHVQIGEPVISKKIPNKSVEDEIPYHGRELAARRSA